MNFPSPAYFICSVDSSTVYIVADHNINYMWMFIMLYSKEDQILIHNLHVRKDMVLKIKSFYKRD